MFEFTYIYTYVHIHIYQTTGELIHFDSQRWWGITELRNYMAYIDFYPRLQFHQEAQFPTKAKMHFCPLCRCALASMRTSGAGCIPTCQDWDCRQSWSWGVGRTSAPESRNSWIWDVLIVFRFSPNCLQMGERGPSQSSLHWWSLNCTSTHLPVCGIHFDLILRFFKTNNWFYLSIVYHSLNLSGFSAATSSSSCLLGKTFRWPVSFKWGACYQSIK